MFHDGHKHIIDTAFHISRECVYFLLNDDYSLRQLKGRKPIDDYETRKTNIHNYCKDRHQYFGPPYYQIHDFCLEQDLYNAMIAIDPDMILKGNDRPDVRDIVGSDKWPVCIIPRIKDKDGEDISTTRKINERDNVLQKDS